MYINDWTQTLYMPRNASLYEETAQGDTTEVVSCVISQQREMCGRLTIQGCQCSGLSTVHDCKAFDKVSHPHLAAKPYHYSVRGNTLDWIQSVLSNCTQEVVLEGKMSFTAAVTSGVPKSTFLGPILFLRYINDLPDHCTSICS